MSSVGTLWKGFCEFCIGIAGPDNFPMCAARAVAKGLEGPLLYELAAKSKYSNLFELEELGRQVVAELGVVWPSEVEARIWLLHRWVREITLGEIEPIVGAQLMWRQGWSKYNKVDVAAAYKFGGFVDYASSWEDRPEIRSIAESESFELAQRYWSDRDTILPKIVIHSMTS